MGDHILVKTCTYATLLRSAVYHKYVIKCHVVLLSSLSRLTSFDRPVQAFIAGGKLGADQISAQRTEVASREAALATLVAGQKAENVRPKQRIASMQWKLTSPVGFTVQLLDFDDDDAAVDNSGADLFAAPSVKNASANPLDGEYQFAQLQSIFA